MKSGWALVLAAVSLAIMSSCVSSSSTIGPTGTGYVWLATQGNQQVSAYNIDLTDGSISEVGNPQSTGVSPVAMALSKDGTALFIANSSDGTITSYSVSSSGSLGTGSSTPTTTTCTQPPPPCNGAPPPPTCGQLPVALAIDPTGKFLFVADQGTFDLCDPSSSSSGIIVTYSINGTGLTFSSAIETESLTDITGSGPSAIAVSPSGNFLYVANQFKNTIASYTYDSTGTLAPLSTPLSTGANPSALAFSRCAGITQATTDCPSFDGDNLFVTLSGDNTIASYAACIQATSTCGGQSGNPTGALTAVSSPVAAGISPNAIIVHPALGFVYAVNTKSNTVTQYRYSSATGALTALSPASISTGVTPFGGGITSDGSYVVISNNNGSTMSLYTTATGGKLAPGATASITVGGQPAAILVR